MARCYAAGYANPASQHQPGQQARRILEDARQRVAEILGADLNCLKPDRLIFTSGGTEANNLAILGIAQARKPTLSGQVIVSSIEHASVLEAAEHLLELGWRLDTLPVDGQGVVQTDALESLLALIPQPLLPKGEWDVSRPSPPAPLPKGRGESRLVSVMLANHETGVLQPDRATGGHMPFGRRAFAHRCGRRGRQDADRLPRAGRGRFEHRRTQVPRTAGHWCVDSPATMWPWPPCFLAAISKRACGRARSRSPWPSACKPPWNFGRRNKTSTAAS